MLCLKTKIIKTFYQTSFPYLSLMAQTVLFLVGAFKENIKYAINSKLINKTRQRPKSIPFILILQDQKKKKRSLPSFV